LAARGSAWSGTFLFGVLLVLLVLIVSWLLRACSPVDPALKVSTREPSFVAPTVSSPAPTVALSASLREAQADGQGLVRELAALQDDLRKKAERCPPVTALPAERWDRKDLGLLKGCWQLGRDAPVEHRFANGPTERATAKAGQLCFGDDGIGTHEQTMVDTHGTWHCKAPITAHFVGDGTLSTEQPTGRCDGNPPATWSAIRLSCRRVNDTTALCQAADKTGRIDLEFRRAP
jgi:hypothetical protein